MFRQKACKKESDWAVTAFPEGNSKDGIIPLQAANNIHTERMKGAVNPGTRRCKLKRRAIQVDKHAPATNNDKEATETGINTPIAIPTKVPLNP